MREKETNGLIDLPGRHSVEETVNSPAYLQARYDLPEELMHNLAIIETLAANMAG